MHQSGVLTAWCSWCHVNLLLSQCTCCAQHTAVYQLTIQCHFIQSHMCSVHMCLVVTCHLCFWLNDHEPLSTTAIIRDGTDMKIRISTES